MALKKINCSCEDSASLAAVRIDHTLSVTAPALQAHLRSADKQVNEVFTACERSIPLVSVGDRATDNISCATEALAKNASTIDSRFEAIETENVPSRSENRRRLSEQAAYPGAAEPAFPPSVTVPAAVGEIVLSGAALNSRGEAEETTTVPGEK